MFSFGSVVIPTNQIFYRSVFSIAFVNISPVLPGHVLVSPLREGLKRCEQMTATECGDLMVTGSYVGRVMERYFGATSITFVMQDGKEAGQSVFHVHLHIIPRRKGDVQGDKIYDQVEKWNHDVDVRPRRSNEEMAEEAEKLRLAMQEQVVIDAAVEELTTHFSNHKVDSGHGIDHALTVLSNCTRAMFACHQRDAWTQEMRMATMLGKISLSLSLCLSRKESFSDLV